MKTDCERTKARLREAAQIAEEVFGQEGKNPHLVAAVLQSLTVDMFADTITKQVEKLTEDLCRAAAVAAGS
jgi:hypothetical protein